MLTRILIKFILETGGKEMEKYLSVNEAAEIMEIGRAHV